MKKNLVIIVIISFYIIIGSCKPVEERIYDHSYTKDWYYLEGQRYQVYQTKKHNKYILILNKRETKFIRKYLK